MLSKIPVLMEKIGKEDIDREILRLAVIAELDAINLYEQMANLVNDKNLKKILLDIAREEKTHVGEFQTMLLKMDEEQVEELKKGKEEIDEILRGG